MSGCAVTNDEAAYLYRPRTARRKILIPADTRAETYRKLGLPMSLLFANGLFTPPVNRRFENNKDTTPESSPPSYGLQFVI
jgi:hypothetical protein